MTKDQLKDKYLSSVSVYRQLEKNEENHIIVLSALRLVTFIGGLIIIWIGFTRSNIAGASFILIFIILFLYLLKLFSAYSARREFLANLAKINQNEADALSGNLSAFDSGSHYSNTKHDFSYDVDLFGPASLFQYLNRTVTGYGKDILAAWLSDPFVLSSLLKQRQSSIRELADKDKWRMDFMASGMKTPLNKNEIDGLLNWIGEDEPRLSTLLRRILIYSLPVVAVVSFLLLIAGIIPYSVFLVIFIGNLLYIASGLKKTNAIHKSLSRKYDFLASMNGLLKAFENETFTSQILIDIKQNISGKGSSASVSVRKLGRLIQSFDSRNNIMMAFVLNGILLWDFLCILRLERWKAEYRKSFPVWLEMIGQVDAYISLGNYAYNNPGFAYPSLSDNAEVFNALDLGHQLLDEKKRVCNNFSIGEKGTVCIISGANMAGKSTFLRTVAINYILAMTGAPVCAREMNFVPARIFTSMRTTDSLSDNESYFYAELRRLSALKLRIEKGEPIFFILDEILKGTNSEDKSMGSKLFLQRILANGGTGLLATHDTSLGKLETEYPGLVINKCFEIEIDDEKISFDYKIQDGITRKMNAVFLMRQMGILD